MYLFTVSFRVPTERRDDFVRAAQRTARDSQALEPGSLLLEVVTDEQDPDVVHLVEGYADATAFRTHTEGPHFAAFFADVSRYAEGPTWLFKGTTPALALGV